MAKFKVGDKVRVRSDLKSGMTFHFWCVMEQMTKHAGKVLTILSIREDSYMVEEDAHHWTDEMFSGLATDQPRREFIVIHQNGNVMTAEHRVNRDVIKSAKATCSENDTFDFMVGAHIAFDKLTGRYVKPQKEPKPAHRFKVGDRVVVLGKYSGEISAIDEKNKYDEPYLVYCPAAGFHSGGENGVHCKPEHLGNCTWRGEKDLDPAPAPEPPKCYTGKVVCISGEYGVGQVFVVKDGFFVDRQYNCPGNPYKSVDDMNDRFLFGKFAEVKE